MDVDRNEELDMQDEIENHFGSISMIKDGETSKFSNQRQEEEELAIRRKRKRKIKKLNSEKITKNAEFQQIALNIQKISTLIVQPPNNKLNNQNI